MLALVHPGRQAGACPATATAFMPLVWLAVWALVALGLSGCVHRRLNIRTDPPGARVYIDDYDVGVTPCSTYFQYYGTRKIRLELDGYETQTVMQEFRPPWYEYPPLDFFSENLWPHEIRDQRVLDFQLIPRRIVPSDEVLRRAEGLRQNIKRDLITPLPVLPSGTGAPPAAAGAPSLPDAFGPPGSSLPALPPPGASSPPGMTSPVIPPGTSPPGAPPL